MDIKKQVKYMIIGVLIFWVIVIAIIFIRKYYNQKKASQLGNIVIKESTEQEAYTDPYEDLEDMPLLDSGYVTFFDNENNLSEVGFITTKGHIFLQEQTTQFLIDNGYENVTTLTVISDTCVVDSTGSEFVAKIDDTEKYIKIRQDYRTEEFTFSIIDSY